MTTQSIVAVADVHQLHQEGTEHLSFDDEHNHSEPNENHTELYEEGVTAEQDWDCHHCCHCHGHSCFAVVMSAASYPLSPTTSNCTLCKENAKLETYSRIFRPPIV
jgi:hypothetical protein